MSKPAIPCAGAVVRDPAGRILVVRRQNPPSAGSWSLPGGRIEPGESAEAAATREVFEETGLVVTVRKLLATLRIGEFAISDFSADVVGGTLGAGDDAAELRWVTLAQLATLPTSPDLVTELRRMGIE